MTLWDELGGRTWSVRAGRRSTSVERRRRRPSQHRRVVRPARETRTSPTPGLSTLPGKSSDACPAASHLNPRNLKGM
jgi:hypothetical protein